MKARVLVVDDSAFMRKVISSILEEDPELEVVDTARDGEEAVSKVLKLRPDVVTMDVEMPRMDGITAVSRIMEQSPVPVVMISSHTREGAEATIRALEAGAIDFVAKPSGPISLDIHKVAQEIREKVKAASRVSPERLRRPKAPVRKVVVPPPQERVPSRAGPVEVVAIGTSTGGPRALQEVIPALPGDLPCGVLVVQHMPPGFTRSLASRLDQLSALRVKEAEDGEAFRPGVVYVAPGDRHMVLDRSDGRYVVRLLDDPPVGGHKPAVDVMMMSVADLAAPRSVGVLMTGMGRDGAKGMKMIRDRGGFTIAEDSSTCVVFGMPRAAIELGGADLVVPLDRIAEEIAKRVLGSGPAS